MTIPFATSKPKRTVGKTITKRWRSMTRFERREALFGYAFIAPVVLGFLIFEVGPILASLVLSFTDYDILSKDIDWVGLKNFARMFQEDLFYKSFNNTIYYCAIYIPLSLILALFLAVLANRAGRASTFYRTAIYIPTIIPSVGAAVAWVVILSPQFGLLNGVLKWFGIKGPGWFLSPVWAKPAIILMSLWVLGGIFVIFLAGLQGIPIEYYEAASIDGASSWISFWKITLPLMTPTILFNLVMDSIWAFQVFQESFVTTGGGPLRSTYFLSLYIYDQAFTYRRMGYASAISWVMFIVIMVFTVIILRSSRKWTFYGGSEQ